MKPEALASAKRTLNILIVEDDYAGRRLLQKILSPYGNCDTALEGEEALRAFRLAWEREQPYNLICLDIMMPKMDGQEFLKRLRAWEQKRGIPLGRGTKVIITTALDDGENVVGAFKSGCEAHIVKPIDKNKLLDEVRNLGLIE